MPNKRSRRKKIPKFHCPYCGERLWRMGSPKHYIYHSDPVSIKENLKTSMTNAKILATKGISCVDRNSWIEEFYCGEHGKMWMLVSKQENGTLAASLITDPRSWKQTTGTIDPDHPNPSVSEYSYRMSRGTNGR